MTTVWHALLYWVLFNGLTVLFFVAFCRRSPEQTDVTFWDDEMGAWMESQR